MSNQGFFATGTEHLEINRYHPAATEPETLKIDKDQQGTIHLGNRQTDETFFDTCFIAVTITLEELCSLKTIVRKES